MTDPPRSIIARCGTASPRARASAEVSGCSSSQQPSRRNTIEEKRRMRNLRKKRMRKKGKQLVKDKVARILPRRMLQKVSIKFLFSEVYHVHIGRDGGGNWKRGKKL